MASWTCALARWPPDMPTSAGRDPGRTATSRRATMPSLKAGTQPTTGLPWPAGTSWSGQDKDSRHAAAVGRNHRFSSDHGARTRYRADRPVAAVTRDPSARARRRRERAEPASDDVKNPQHPAGGVAVVASVAQVLRRPLIPAASLVGD